MDETSSNHRARLDRQLERGVLTQREHDLAVRDLSTADEAAYDEVTDAIVASGASAFILVHTRVGGTWPDGRVVWCWQSMHAAVG